MKRIQLIFFLLMSFGLVAAHPWKPANYVIIDTDGGFDDMRTICMFLASPNVRVLAITCSNGVVNARDCYKKTKELLSDLHHEGILTGMNENPEAAAKDCKPAIDFKWGSSNPEVTPVPDAIGIVEYVLEHTQDPITFISLGSLITASDCSKRIPAFRQRIKTIAWTADSTLDRKNFNFKVSPSSYNYIVHESGIPLSLIVGESAINPYNSEYISRATRLYTPEADKVVYSLNRSDPFAKNWFDEMACIFIHYPVLFNSDTTKTQVVYHLNPSIEVDSLQHYSLTILDGNTVNQNQVLVSFPMDTSAYFPDVMKKMKSTLQRYGKDEWVACVLGNELHRHLGVYAVIGTKMGIRAREYFGAGVDEFKVLSFAGEVPPYSCLNDGIQVSTGATLGHGLIHISQDTARLPGAYFTYLGQTIEISLKEEYREKIEKEINDLSSVYSLNSNIYWEFVRIAALNYWANWDRHNIFTIRMVK